MALGSYARCNTGVEKGMGTGAACKYATLSLAGSCHAAMQITPMQLELHPDAEECSTIRGVEGVMQGYNELPPPYHVGVAGCSDLPLSRYTIRFVRQKMSRSRFGVNHFGCCGKRDMTVFLASFQVQI